MRRAAVTAPRLLVARWRTGAGPRGHRPRYRPPGEQAGGLLLMPGGVDTALPGGIEQASLYRHLQGSPPGPGFLDGTAPIVVCGADVAPEAAGAWDAWCRDEHFPAVLALPGYAAGARFRVHRRLREGCGHDPEWLTLYQLDGEDALRLLEDPSEAALAVREEWRLRGEPLVGSAHHARFLPA